MKKKLPLVSISIPTLNEFENLEPLYNRLDKLSKKMSNKCNLEFVFSDNKSEDGTWAKLIKLSLKDKRIKAIKLSKNFGFQKSILANFMHTRGEAVMQLDADLQDPPELLEKFFLEWEKGYKVVYGIRETRSEGFLINTFRKFGYWIIKIFSENSIPMNAGDFRLIDRKIVDLICKSFNPKPYLRGMIAELGFNQKGIPYQRDRRIKGNSKFGIIKLMSLGINAITNHSTVPLRLASFFGLVILFLSILGSAYYFYLKFSRPDLPEGLASVHVIILFGIGLNCFILGILGEYLLKIYLILKKEPTAIIEDSINFQPDDLKL